MLSDHPTGGHVLPRTVALFSVLLTSALCLGCGDDTIGEVGGAGGAGGAGGVGGNGPGGAGGGGSGGSDAGLSIAAIDDQTVIRNLDVRRSFEVEVTVAELQGPFSLEITSTDDSVLSATTRDCEANPCPLTLAPSPLRTARIDVTVKAIVDDLEGETSFAVDVQPRLVRDANDGDPAPAGSLRDAFAGAEDGDVIGFDFDGAATISLVQALSTERLLWIEGPADDRVTIKSPVGSPALRLLGEADVTVLDVDFEGAAPEQGRSITLEDESRLELTGSTLRNGLAQDGGSIRSEGDLIVQNSTFADNVAGRGGAIYVAGGTVRISDTVFDHNGNDPIIGGALGGAIWTRVGATLLRVRFVRNYADLGGAMLLAGPLVVSIEDSEIGDRLGMENGGNRARLGGGAYLTPGATLNLVSTSVELNQAERGAGVFVGGSSLMMTVLNIATSRIEENFATQLGGGIFLDSGTITMDDASAIGPENEAGQQDGGGGIWVTRGGDISGVPRNRVNGNRAGPMGASSDVNFDPSDF